ncbi:MAG: hypothetical protein DIU83_07830, partial [Bacillota bacterium]
GHEQGAFRGEGGWLGRRTAGGCGGAGGCAEGAAGGRVGRRARRAAARRHGPAPAAAGLPAIRRLIPTSRLTIEEGPAP